MSTEVKNNHCGCHVNAGTSIVWHTPFRMCCGSLLCRLFAFSWLGVCFGCRLGQHFAPARVCGMFSIYPVSGDCTTLQQHIVHGHSSEPSEPTETRQIHQAYLPCARQKLVAENFLNCAACSSFNLVISSHRAHDSCRYTERCGRVLS